MKKNPIAKWFKPNFDITETSNETTDHSSGIPVKNKSTKKPGSKKAITSKNELNINLLNKVSPQNISDLSVHTKKISEVEEWLKYNVLHSNKCSILLLNGPSGAGKTATLQVLCKSMNIKIIEWINPIDINIESDEIFCLGQTAKFSEFLIESSRYLSLLINSKTTKQITLVEDFPNSLLRNPSEFHTILETLFHRGKYCVVFICTETKDSSTNLDRLLFPDSIKNKFNITTISFNPVSVTLLQNTLKRANLIISEQFSDIYQCARQETIDTIVNSSMGDIRSALNYYNFACLKGSTNLPTTIQSIQQPGNKRKRKEKNKGTLTHMSRDESLGLLHGVGRVLYPKRIQFQNSWKFEHQPEKIVNQFISMPTLFVMFLHENYWRYFSDFNDVSKAAETLSFAEILLTNWKDEFITKYGLWISICGLMIANKNSVAKWNPVQGPKQLKLKQIDQFHENEKISSIDSGYYDIIKPNGYISNGPRFK